MDTDTITFRKQLNGITKVDMEEYFDEAELTNLYHWLDRIPLSRPKKNIVSDFSDGVLVSEIIAHYLPKYVELHNYSPASATKQKMENWYHLNGKVLRKLDLDLSDDVIRALVNTTNPKPRVVEKVLMLLRMQIDKILKRQEALVPTRSTGRRSPEKISSPRKYNKGEIPHGHPDRSTYLPGERKPIYEPKLFIVPSSENVPRSLLEEKEIENIAKNETIKILNTKIRRLEHLLNLKEIRIEDLQSQLAQVQDMYYIRKRYR